jgi:hypothetical protein
VVNTVSLVHNFAMNLASYGYDGAEFKPHEMSHVNSELTTTNDSSFIPGLQNISMSNPTIQNIANEINTNVMRMHYPYPNGSN